MRSRGTKGSTGKGNAGGKGSTREERVEGCGEVRWRRDLEQTDSTGFWEGKCGTKREVRGIEGRAGGKGSTGMWNETQAKQQSLAGK